MTRDTVLGAGGVQSDWAVWAGGMAKSANDLAPVAEEPLQASQASNDAEASALKARYELLERENELLRQRLTIADRQVEVKDAQINDFKAITENLTRQNQVLLMLAQGVPMERILKGGGQEIDVWPRRVTDAGKNTRRASETAKAVDTLRERIASRLRELAGTGMTQCLMAEALNNEEMPTLSGVGKWNRRKVGAFFKKWTQ